MKPTLLVPLVLLAGATGCATAPPSGHDPLLPRPASLAVKLDGLHFLTLRSPRKLAVDQMREHGYLCLDEAATASTVPCTPQGAAGSSVVLSFSGSGSGSGTGTGTGTGAGALDAVRVSLPPSGGDPRDQFEDLFESSRRSYPRSYIQHGDTMTIARLIPGDGTTVELRYFIGAEAIQLVHFAPLERPSAPKVLRR